MRGSPGSWTGIGPFCDHLGIDRHLIVDRQQRDGSEFVEQMIADFPGDALAFLGIHEFGELQVLLLNELVLKEMTIAFAVVGGPHQFLGGPQAGDIGPDAAGHLFGSIHAGKRRFVDRLQRRLDAHIIEVRCDGFGDLGQFRLARAGKGR